MNRVEKLRIEKLFLNYGFHKVKTKQTDQFLIFSFNSGFFKNAEIVSLKKYTEKITEKTLKSKERELKSLNLAVNISFYENIDEIEKKLFEGFFDTENWRKKTQEEYESHSKKVLKSVPSNNSTYNYIESNYKKNETKGEISLISDIVNETKKLTPSLSIIEAPAGYGKTCTSYEIIKKLSESKDNSPLPFFTEFSRDRNAKVFEHLLIREVDKSFSAVNSSVVLEEVKNGKIVIVLDGFDELLHDEDPQNGSSDEKNFELATPMLETIGELLAGSSKIILTSRRTALFDGKLFNEWIIENKESFNINRYRLEEPTINEWLTEEKIDLIERKGISINDISNPVLLTYLRSIETSEINSLLTSPQNLTDFYFESMMERERERQDLIMSPETQTNILFRVALDMCEKNYTSEKKDLIVDFIKNECQSEINYCRTLYPAKNRPTLEKISVKLSNHAFFDRCKQDDSKISFLNEFVFGHFIGIGISKQNDDWICHDERFIEPAILANVASNIENKKNIWKKLSLMTEFLDKSEKMRLEIKLLNRVDSRSYSESHLSSLNLKKTIFFKECKLFSSVFHDCQFTDVEFNSDNLEDITFINCQFWNCKHTGVGNVSFYNCNSNNNLIKKMEESQLVTEDISASRDSEIERYIANKLLPTGSQQIDRIHYFYAELFKGNQFTKKEITKGVKSLRRKGYLSDANDKNFIALNSQKINEFKREYMRVPNA